MFNDLSRSRSDLTVLLEIHLRIPYKTIMYLLSAIAGGNLGREVLFIDIMLKCLMIQGLLMKVQIFGKILQSNWLLLTLKLM